MEITAEKLAEMIGGAVKSAVAELAPADGTQASAQVFAPNVHTQERRPESKSLVGSYFGVMGKAKGDAARALEYAKTLYGDEAKITKALTSQDAGGADEFVPITVAREVIEALRAASVIRQMGPRIIENPTGQLEIPRFSAGVAMSWTGEATGVNATQQTTDTVTLTWKKGVIKVPYTRELVLHSAPDIEAAIEADVMAAMAVGSDAAYIRGASGGNNPVGIRNQTAAGNVIAANATVNATNVEDDLRKLMQAVLGNNVMVSEQTGAWIMSVRSKLYLMNLRDANGNLIFPELRAAQPRMYGYRVFTTNSIPDNLGGGTDESEVYFGAAPSVLIADATQMSVEVLQNVAYLDDGGTLVSGVDLDTSLIKATLRTDMALRHDVSWSILTGVTWGA